MSAFLHAGNSLRPNEMVQRKTPRKVVAKKPRKPVTWVAPNVTGDLYTDHVWRWNELAGKMVMVGIYDAAPSRSLEPMADTRVAIPDMNTEHGRRVIRAASATPSVANLVTKVHTPSQPKIVARPVTVTQNGLTFVGEW